MDLTGPLDWPTSCEFNEQFLRGELEGLGMATVGHLARQYVGERLRRSEIGLGTARGLRCVLMSFLRHVGHERRPSRITRRHVESWLEHHMGTVATKRKNLSVVRVFFDWLIENGHVRSNPTVGIRQVRQPRTVPRALQRPQVQEALARAPTRGRVIMLLMVQEGLRAIEVSRLELGDIDFNLASMLVKGKGDHERLLPISDETMLAIHNYQAEGRGSHAGPLVASERHPGRGLRPGTISQLVGGWLHGVGVKDSGHALRHTMATDMLSNGANIRDVQYALGHASLTTTQRYLTHVIGNLREQMSGRSYLE